MGEAVVLPLKYSLAEGLTTAFQPSIQRGEKLVHSSKLCLAF